MKKQWQLPVPESWVNNRGYDFLSKTPWGLHPGFDFNHPDGGYSDLGKPVFAANDGRVDATIESNAGFGNHIFIKHETDGEVLYSHYAHLQLIQVDENQRVERGQQIGTCGSTGNSSASHLHFEIRKPIGQGYEFWPSNWNAEKITKYYHDPVEFIKRSQEENSEMNKDEIKDLIDKQIEGKADKNDIRPKFEEIRSDIKKLNNSVNYNEKVINKTKSICKDNKDNIKILLNTTNGLRGDLRGLESDLKKVIKINSGFRETLEENIVRIEKRLDKVEGVLNSGTSNNTTINNKTSVFSSIVNAISNWLSRDA